MAKKLVKSSKDASWARMPPISNLSVIQAQFFDNRTKAAGVKGRSDFSIKLFAWWSQWNLDIKKAEWWRVVQLIDPKTVLTWAKKKHAVGDMDAAMFEIYETVCHAAIEQAQEDGAEIVKMGHIASPPGTQYFVGQFVFPKKMTDGTFEGFIFREGEHFLLDALKPTKKRGSYRKAGTPTHALLHDPGNIFERQKIAAEQQAAIMSARPAPVANDDFASEVDAFKRSMPF